MNDYTVLVNLKGEAISLGANDTQQAIAKAKEIITEQYGESVANDAEYKLGEQRDEWQATKGDAGESRSWRAV